MGYGEGGGIMNVIIRVRCGTAECFQRNGGGVGAMLWIRDTVGDIYVEVVL